MEYVTGFCKLRQTNLVVLINSKGLLNGICGSVQNADLPRNTLAKEFFKQTELGTSSNDWVHYVTIRSRIKPFPVTHYFFTISAMARLCKNVVFMDLDDLSNVTPNLKWLLPLAFNPQCYIFKRPLVLEVA